MHAKVSAMFPVPVAEGFAFVRDVTRWPFWYVGLLAASAPEGTAWSRPGDTIAVAYKLLGRRLAGHVVLEEMARDRLMRLTVRVPALREVHQAYRFAAAGPSDFTLDIEMDCRETRRYFGRIIDPHLVPRVLRRDLEVSMENLNDIFAAGMHR